MWPSLDALAGRWSVGRTFTPAMDAGQREALYDGWRRAVERARGWAQ
jgi:glycerol kinase